MMTRVLQDYEACRTRLAPTPQANRSRSPGRLGSRYRLAAQGGREHELDWTLQTALRLRKASFWSLRQQAYPVVVIRRAQPLPHGMSAE